MPAYFCISFTAFCLLCALGGQTSNLYVPALDMSRFDTDYENLSKDIVRAFSTSGFLAAVNVPGLNATEIKLASKWFFDLPKETKMSIVRRKWNTNNAHSYRGYNPLVPGDSSYKEFFDVGRDVDDRGVSPTNESLYEHNVWPPEPSETTHGANLRSFRAIMTEHHDRCQRLALKILGAIEHQMSLEPQSLVSMFEPFPLSTGRLIHSPPRHQNDNDFCVVNDTTKKYDDLDFKYLVTPDHSDSGFMTLLLTFDEGLQIYPPGSDKWVDVPVLEDTLIVNIGMTLSKMLNKTLLSTRHRVLNTQKRRFSAPFFLEARWNADVGDGVLFGPWLVNAMKRFVEWDESNKDICWWNETTGETLCTVDGVTDVKQEL